MMKNKLMALLTAGLMSISTVSAVSFTAVADSQSEGLWFMDYGHGGKVTDISLDATTGTELSDIIESRYLFVQGFDDDYDQYQIEGDTPFTFEVEDDSVAKIKSKSDTKFTVLGITGGDTSISVTAPNGLTGVLGVHVNDKPYIYQDNSQGYHSGRGSDGTLYADPVQQSIISVKLFGQNSSDVRFEIDDTSVAEIVSVFGASAYIRGISYGETTFKATLPDGTVLTAPLVVETYAATTTIAMRTELPELPVTSVTTVDHEYGTSPISYLKGDANGDGRLTLNDAVAILQYVALPAKYPLTGQCKSNADCDGSAGITGGDALWVQLMDAGMEPGDIIYPEVTTTGLPAVTTVKTTPPPPVETTVTTTWAPATKVAVEYDPDCEYSFVHNGSTFELTHTTVTAAEVGELDYSYDFVNIYGTDPESGEAAKTLWSISLDTSPDYSGQLFLFCNIPAEGGYRNYLAVNSGYHPEQLSDFLEGMGFAEHWDVSGSPELKAAIAGLESLAAPDILPGGSAAEAAASNTGLKIEDWKICVLENGYISFRFGGADHIYFIGQESADRIAGLMNS